MTQNLNPQNLKPGQTCEDRMDGGDYPITFYYLGFACGTSAWQKQMPWSAKDRERAKTGGCGMCCCCDD
jgi:hypothetical protein